MRPRCLFIGLFCFFIPPVAGAEEPCVIASAQDVVACALRRHPDILQAEAKRRSAYALEDVARQRPNPEADAQSTSFSENDRPALKIEADLVHTFEWGGKRSKRIAEARSRGGLAETELLKTQEQVALQTALHLYRLRQLGVEVQTLEEGIHTFIKVVEAFRSRSVRSAEQEVSLNVFALARSDHALRKSSLLQERLELQTYFEAATGMPFEKILAVLPPERRDWPEILPSSSSRKSAARRDAEGHLEVSQRQLAATEAAAWPDLKLGPRIETESGHGQNAQGYGIALALPLPLYQRQQGTRRFTQHQVEEARIALNQKERELDAERRKWALVYRQALTAYRQEPSLEDLHGQHHSLESLFERGMVPATLVIEAHRQVAEYVKTRHEQELRALEALGSIYALDGTILNEHL